MGVFGAVDDESVIRFSKFKMVDQIPLPKIIKNDHQFHMHRSHVFSLLISSSPLPNSYHVEVNIYKSIVIYCFFFHLFFYLFSRKYKKKYDSCKYSPPLFHSKIHDF